jgi:uncharacterized membrane protein
MEAEWMKQIPSESICTFFYSFFVLYAVIAVLALVATLGFFGMAKKLGGYGIAGGIGYLFATVLAGTQALFFYLICDRALLGKKDHKLNKQVTPMY